MIAWYHTLRTIAHVGARTPRICRPFSGSSKLGISVKGFDKSQITLTDIIEGKPSEEVSFRGFFLRDACTSPVSVDVSTTQKTFSTAQLPSDLAVMSAEIAKSTVNNDKEVLKVSWSDGHVSEFPEAFLHRNATHETRREFRYFDQPYRLWDSLDQPLTSDLVLKVDYNDYITNEETVNKVTQALHDLGIAYIENMPDQKGIVDKTGNSDFDLAPQGTGEPVLVEEVAKRIGYVKETFYGRSWNVISVPEAKNVAYTSVYLPLHMDLLYYESPPGVQLLHVIYNSTKGGESIFADSYAAVTDILRKDPEAYDALTKVPITYHYDNDGYHYYYSRPLIVEDPYGGVNPSTGRPYIHVVNYSPPFQGPLDAFAPGSGFTPAELDAFLRGLRLFETYIEDKRNQIEFKMKENCCVIFMNRRALHARNEFEAGTGRRWFRGTYLDLDSYQSRLRVANKRTRFLD